MSHVRTMTRRESVVILNLVSGTTPDYCVHGRATCVVCGRWCWLGSNTLRLVDRGHALPLCDQCAPRVIPPGTPVDAHINDHKRDDGPHR